MASFHDKEFGTITIRRSAMSRSMKLSVAPNGSLRISMPSYAPLFMAKRFITSSRPSIREMYAKQSLLEYHDGMQIGKSHSLSVMSGTPLRATKQGRVVTLRLPDTMTLHDSHVRQALGEQVIKALRQESKSYLPRRVSYLASKYGFSYEQVRFSHASSRWGSCSSRGTISLNIALMMLPFELIDYVIIHELCHTKQMNHSRDFWQLVEAIIPDYHIRKNELSSSAPYII